MTVKVGDTFAADYCDGRYGWTVDEVIDGRVVLASSEMATRDWGIGQKAWTVEDVEMSIRFERKYSEASKQMADFWESARVGDTLHYHNGFGEFVRGVVVIEDGEKKLQPTAMVGDWTYHWEYYWAKLVKGDGAWQPHVSTIYEFGSSGGEHGGDDPRTMTPLDFTGRTNDYLEHLLKD